MEGREREELKLFKAVTVTIICYFLSFREFGITLERKESEEVEGLRRRWNELSDTANRVSDHINDTA